MELTEPAKNPASSNSAGAGSNASAKSPIQVVPIWATSGVCPPAMAVWYLLCAASQGMAVTSTVTPGLAASNSLSNAGRFSPSAPCAHIVSVPVAGPSEIDAAGADDSVADPVSLLRPQALSTSTAASRPAA